MTKDISIGQHQWIKWVELDPNDESLFNIDILLESTEQFWRFLETECVPGCCGIHAFALWPKDIQNASKHFDRKELKVQLSRLKDEVVQVDKSIVVSNRLNNLFDKSVFIQLIDHILSHL